MKDPNDCFLDKEGVEKDNSLPPNNETLFTEDELRILDLLGLSQDPQELVKQVAREQSRLSAEKARSIKSLDRLPPEYDLCKVYVCKTCGTVTRKLFHMTRDLKLGILVSVPAEKVGFGEWELKTIQSDSKFCQSCPTIMRTWSKDRLIKIIIGNDNLTKNSGGSLVCVGTVKIGVEVVLGPLGEDEGK